MLWSGTTLLVLAVFAFAGYAWAMCSPLGRFLLLLVPTVVVWSTAATLARRLPATADALGCLSLAMVAADWALVHSAGVGGGLGAGLWWCFGSLLLATAGLGLGWAGVRCARVIGAAAGSVAVSVALVVELPVWPAPHGADVLAAVCWAGLATAGASVAARVGTVRGWRASAVAVLVGAVCWQLLAWTSAALAAVEAGHGAGAAARAALALCATAGAPALSRRLLGRPVLLAELTGTGDNARPTGPRLGFGVDALGFLVLAATVGGVAFLLASFSGTELAPAVILGLAAALVAAVRRWVPDFSRPAGVLALVMALPAALSAVGPAFTVVFWPLHLWAHAWSGSGTAPAISAVRGLGAARYLAPVPADLADLAGLAALAMAAMARAGGPAAEPAAGRMAWLPRATAAVVVAAAGVAAVTLAAVMAGLDVTSVVLVELLAGSALVLVALGWASARRRERCVPCVLGCMAGALGLSAMGWAGATRGTTLVVLAVLAVWGAAATAVAGRAPDVGAAGAAGGALGSACLCALAGVAVDVATGRPDAGALAAAVVGAGLLLASRAERLGRARQPMELVALAAFAVAWVVPVRQHSLVSLAMELTLSAAGLALASSRADRPGYRWVSALGVLPLCCTWLTAATGDVDLGSAVVVALAAGLLFASRAAWFSGPRAAVEAETLAGLFAPCLFPLHEHAWAWSASELTVAMAAFALFSLRADRPAYRWAAAAMTVPVACAWLAAAGSGDNLGSVVVVAVAGSLLSASALRSLSPARHPLELEVNITFALASLVPVASRSWGFVALDLSVVMAAYLVACVRPLGRYQQSPRFAYRWAAALMAVPVSWSWLLATGVHAVEAYTWLTALLGTAVAYVAGSAPVPRTAGPEALGTTGTVRRLGPGRGRVGAARLHAVAYRELRQSSWLVFAPGLCLALFPSTAMAMGAAAGSLRPVFVLGSAFVVVLGGARARLQAPIVLGAATLVFFGLQAACPLVHQAPLWATLGAAGAVLVWLGATVERRTAEVRRITSGFRRLG
jgi:hypothetical protein